jgi:hypothetical protein
MASHPNSLPRPVVVAALGAVWGWGCARLLAETLFLAALYASFAAVVLFTALSALVSVLLDRLLHGTLRSAAVWVSLALPLPYAIGVISSPLEGGVLVFGAVTLVLLLGTSQSRRDTTPVLLAVCCLGLYVRTLLPSIGEADTFEFQVIVPRLGVAHPTGYPLYVLSAKLFSLLAIGDLPWRVNLFSAACATGAVVCQYALIRRITGSRPISALASAGLAFSRVFWSQAIIAEVYALNSFMVAVILWILLEVRTGVPSDRQRTGLVTRWWLLALGFGLSLANHVTTFLLVPAALAAILMERPKLPGRQWGGALALFAVGLSLYLFIPLRWPALNNGETLSFEAFVSHVTGAQFQEALRFQGWLEPQRWRIVLGLLRQPYGLAGLSVAAAGAVVLWKRGRDTFVITALSLSAYVLYGVAYHVPDVSVFVLPAHLPLAVWVGCGMWRLLEVLEGAWSKRTVQLHAVGVVLMATLPLSRVWLNLGEVDRSSEDGSEDWGRQVLSLPVEPGAAILADVKKFAPLYYLQQIHGIRRDLDVVLLGTEEQYRGEVTARLDAGQPVYLGRYLPHLAEYSLNSVGPLVRVTAGPVGLSPTYDSEIQHRFADKIRLLGATIDSVETAPLEPVGATLYWRAEAAVSSDFRVQLRLADNRGEVPWQSDGARPVSAMYPTNGWRPGEVVADYHEIQVPPHVAPGLYALQVTLSPEPGASVPAGMPVQSWVTVSELQVGDAEGAPSLATSFRALTADYAWVTGFDLPEQVRAGSSVAVSLGWLVSEPSTDQHLSMWWEPGGERAVSARNGGRFRRLDGRMLINSYHRIPAPDSEGEYRLFFALTDREGESVPVRCGWLAPPSQSCEIAQVQAIPEEGVANFGESIVLLAGGVADVRVTPGSAVQVDLTWRGLRGLAEDYTVFVHLVGPDGRLHGQVDRWPVQGTYPTSAWIPGMVIADSYSVLLDSTAEDGRYSVEVGLYLLDTMQRLPVMNADGSTSRDWVIVGGFDVAG